MTVAKTAVRSHILTIVCLCLMSLHIGAQTARVDESTVRIIPVDPSGTEVTDIEVYRFESLYDMKDLAKHFHGNTATGIPYGFYRAQLSVRGFSAEERVVHVFQPKVIAVVGLSIGAEGGRDASDASGHVQNIDRTGLPVRVRLVGIYSSTIDDAEVSGSGDFFFARVPAGSYVVVASQGDKLLGVRPVKFPTQQLPILIGGDERSVEIPNKPKQ